jgi:Na+-driven multidrug efflux pump
VLVIASLTAVPQTVANILGQALIADGRIKFSLLGNIGWAAVLVASSLLLLHMELGAEGVAFGTLLSYVALAGMYWYFISWNRRRDNSIGAR